MCFFEQTFSKKNDKKIKIKETIDDGYVEELSDGRGRSKLRYGSPFLP